MLDAGNATRPPQIDDVRSRLVEMAQAAGCGAMARDLTAQIEASGRMVRARLTLSVADALGRDGVPAAAGVEALHLASLVHDDLCDGARSRRGLPSIWASRGTGCAIASGDLLIATAFGALGDDQPALPGRLALMQRAVAVTIRGQAMDLSARSDTMPIGTYLRLAARKSGPLLGLGPALVLRADGRPADARRILRAARWLAVAYQIADDMTDVAEDAASGAPNIVTRAGRDTAGHLADRALDRARRIAAPLPHPVFDAFDHWVQTTRGVLTERRHAV